MKTSRLAIAGLAVFAVAGLVAGCGAKNGTTAGASPTAKATPSPALAPKAALAASILPLATSSYQFTITSAALTGNGAADQATQAATLTATGTAEGVSIKLDFIRIGNDAYAKLDFGGLNGQLGIQSDKYLHLDVTKLGASPSLPLNLTGSPVDLAGLLTGVNDDVKTTDGGRTYTGTIDLTKATGDNVPDADVLKNVGDKAKAVPFTAKLDDQGRLSDLKIDGSAIDPQLSFETSITGYGTAANVTKPDDSQVVEAPDSVLKLFSS